MIRASTLCFAILAVKMCMSNRFRKIPESPKEMGIKSIWFEGVEDLIENTRVPDSFDKTQETDVIIHGYLIDSSLHEIRHLALQLKAVRWLLN